MINQPTPPSPPSPDRARPSRRDAALAAAVCCVVLLGACEKKKKAPPPPPPPPPPAIVIPDPIDINGVMAQLSPDARVKFPERNAPADASLAEAVITLASNLAKGDADGMRNQLGPEARTILDTLISDGSWAEETGKIEQVRIVQLSPLQDAEPRSAQVVLAIQAPGGAYPLAWEGQRSGSGWVFRSLTTESVERPRASDFDTLPIRVGSTLAAPEPELDAPSEEEENEDVQPEAPAEEPEPSGGSRKKSTPAGPISLPG